ncbi:MAG: AAA family ATPase [Lachnospiraceae bacterium]|nr:AAA family ATPase [Lachnospiraceae bacterium]
MAEKAGALLDLVPSSANRQIDWQAIEQSQIRRYITKMQQTQQNPVWHAEGDVWTHTKMVCEELIRLPAFWQQERRKQEELFVAALLHDIGKIPCTQLEDGVWTSPNHTAVGARMAREFLWTEYGCCGTEELQIFRETVCNLIRYHSVPPHIMDQSDPARRLLKIAANGELVPDFSIRLLCLFEAADMRGRISDSVDESLELVRLCAEMATECGCLDAPGEFPDAFSEYAYLSGRNILPGQPLYDDTWGEVILLSGLPGTGKDTWIREHCPGYPVVSLDDIRRKMKISPKDNQGVVAQAAREQARGYLRKKIPFVWNATDLTPLIRGKQVSLFEDYHASVRIIYLETDWETRRQRNEGRAEAEFVPESAVCQMLGNLILPERFEAHRVEWKCV